LLGSRELFIAQRARIMELGELLNLGCQIWRRRLLYRSYVLHRGRSILLLLGLRIDRALLVSLVILLLGSRILLGIFLLLVV
jgi:Mn2+/Fe2+ NRAMP family transporter